MAQAGCVFDVVVPDQPRTPEQILARQPGQPPPQAPEASGTWYTADITGGAAGTIAALFSQAGRRDPARDRTWIALTDGDNHQISQIQDQAAARGVPVTILIDFVHVQEYLWKAAWCFHRPRDPAIEAWVTAQELDILHGRAAQVTARIKALAAAHPPRPGSEHDKIIAKTLSYLQNKQLLGYGLVPNLFALVEAGYAVVYQDCRGTFRSAGDFTPMLTEADDGADTVAWTLGRGTGDPQLLADLGAMLADPQPHLEALPPSHQPVLEKVWPWWSELLSHPSRDQFWQDLSVLDQAGQVTVPALHIGGWFDIFAANTARSFTELRSRAGIAEAREGQRLIIGPWDHLNSTGIYPDRRFGLTADAINTGTCRSPCSPPRRRRTPTSPASWSTCSPTGAPSS